MQEDKIDDLLLKVLENKASDKELQLFNMWIEKNRHNRQIFDSLKLLWQQKSSSQDQKTKKVRDLIWQRSKTRSNHFSFSIFMKIAASLILLIAVILSYKIYTQNQRDPSANQLAQAEWVEKEAIAGVKLETVLPDGSIVKLNSNSRILYQKDFTDSLRVIQLWGEAYFDVVKDSQRPFKVITEGLETQVLGTEFNVSAYHGEEIMVSLVEGKVKVTHPRMDSAVYLAAGKSIRFNQQDSYSVQQFDPQTITGWKNGNLVFNKVTFEDFVKKLERWYGVQVTVSGKRPGKWNLNGTFSNEPLEHVLEYISYGRAFKYEIENENVLLKF